MNGCGGGGGGGVYIMHPVWSGEGGAAAVKQCSSGGVKVVPWVNGVDKGLAKAVNVTE